MGLDRELATYEAHLLELLADEGKFVVIKGDQILGAFSSYEEALRAGYDHYGATTFLVRKIQRDEPVHYFAHDIPCPS